MATEILSDDEIERLLQEAEARLRQKAGVVILPDPDELSLTAPNLEGVKSKPLPKLNHGLTDSSYLTEHKGVAQTKASAIVDKKQQRLADKLRSVAPANQSSKINDQQTSGPQWFDMPKTEITPSLKRDLQIIEMRSVLDPSRHYRKNVRKGKIPAFSQVGTVIEGPTEFYSSRINKRDRSKNFVEETLTAEKNTGYFKRKYSEIQDAKTSGKKGHYKELMEKRKKRP